ncbi:hypothetical protein IM774_08925 [Erysipelotrichaceae bacterium RD49]|nr:hypothetical protein [Erysipelotrichaceae bacterium RD49]
MQLKNRDWIFPGRALICGLNRKNHPPFYVIFISMLTRFRPIDKPFDTTKWESHKMNEASRLRIAKAGFFYEYKLK